MQRQRSGDQPKGLTLLTHQLLRQPVRHITQQLYRFLNLETRGFGYIGRFIEYPGHGLIGDTRMAGNVFQRRAFRLHGPVPYVVMRQL